MRIVTTLFFALILALFAGCAEMPASFGGKYQSSALGYTAQQAQQAQSVQLGTVLSVQHVVISPDRTTTATGSGLGAVAGGLVGSRIGRGNGRTAMTLVGAVTGLVAGHQVVARAYQQPGLEITIKLDNGQLVSVTQAEDVAVSQGQRVKLIGNSWYGSPARILPI